MKLLALSLVATVIGANGKMHGRGAFRLGQKLQKNHALIGKMNKKCFWDDMSGRFNYDGEPYEPAEPGTAANTRNDLTYQHCCYDAAPSNNYFNNYDFEELGKKYPNLADAKKAVEECKDPYCKLETSKLWRFRRCWGPWPPQEYQRRRRSARQASWPEASELAKLSQDWDYGYCCHGGATPEPSPLVVKKRADAVKQARAGKAKNACEECCENAANDKGFNNEIAKQCFQGGTNGQCGLASYGHDSSSKFAEFCRVVLG